MSCRLVVLCSLVVLGMTLTAAAVDKNTARAVRLDETRLKQLRSNPYLVTADTCTVINIDSLVWKIDNWVVGDELYKVLLDPMASCNISYPFSVTEVHIIMYFYAPTPLIYGGDIEDVDYSNPTCPVPDTLIALSPNYEDQVTSADLWDIWVDFDPPVVVNSPFFAGFYIGGGIEPASAPAVVTDGNPVLCSSYNMWDESVGWVDLSNNQWYSFPGRLAMFAVGYPGGSVEPSQPEPELTLLALKDNEILMGSADIWAWENSGSQIIDYVSFEYSSGGPYVSIGSDFDGSSPLRDGAAFAASGSGFSLSWDFSGLTEGTCWLRATAYDTLGRSAADSLIVYLEPTPPTPLINAPATGTGFCDQLAFLMTTSDENLSHIQIQRRQANYNYSAGMQTFDVTPLGAQYNGPAAAALAVMLWADRGYSYLIKEGSRTLSIAELTQKLATQFGTEENQGTYDEALYQGLSDYFLPRGNVLVFDYMRNPDYFSLRTWVEEEQRAVIIGLSGAPGVWLTVDGFRGWVQSDGSYQVSVSNPLTGSISHLPMRSGFGAGEVYVNGNWQRVDLMVSMLAKDWSVTRNFVGIDFDESDGWSVDWTPYNVSDDSLYFFRAIGHDANGLEDVATVLLQYACSQMYTPGDYTGDGDANIMDLIYLTDFLVRGGPPPVGGAERADANGDGFVNIADVVYYINFIYRVADPPSN